MYVEKKKKNQVYTYMVRNIKGNSIRLRFIYMYSKLSSCHEVDDLSAFTIFSAPPTCRAKSAFQSRKIHDGRSILGYTTVRRMGRSIKANRGPTRSRISPDRKNLMSYWYKGRLCRSVFLPRFSQ